MKNFLNSWYQGVVKRFRNHHEELTLLIAFLLFFLSPPFFRLFDPTAGSYDAGVLQLIILAIVALCVFQSFTWLVMRIVWPSIRAYLENDFVFDFNTLQPWQKITVSLFVYFLPYLFLVLLYRAISG